MEEAGAELREERERKREEAEKERQLLGEIERQFTDAFCQGR